jgi:hypothetical protein
MTLPKILKSSNDNTARSLHLDEIKEGMRVMVVNGVTMECLFEGSVTNVNKRVIDIQTKDGLRQSFPGELGIRSSGSLGQDNVIFTIKSTFKNRRTYKQKK